MLKIRSVEEFMQEPLEATPMVIAPWLPTEGLAMIAGPTGIGKTMLALSIAMAIASGTPLLGWEVPEPRRVLYVDGEMALLDIRQRFEDLIAGRPAFATAPANLFLLSHADQPKGIPNLIESKAVRLQIEQALDELEIEVLTLDNLSALCNSEAENDAESWTVMQDWLIKLRRKGITVIFLHHTGKPNDHGRVKQRGTSKREDVLNTTMLLLPECENGFEVTFPKHRGFSPQHEVHVRMDFEPGLCTLKTVEERKGKKGPDMKRIERELAA